jgi:hypothetical protein
MPELAVEPKPSAVQQSDPGPPPSGLPPPAAETLRAPGPGEPLAPSLRERFVRSLGVEPDTVRVHADARAQRATASVGARAFAFGVHVFLGPGERATDVDLLAHEVAHVVQQQGAPALQLYGGGSRGDAFEHEAAASARAVGEGQTASVRLRTGGPRVQRQGRLARAWSAVKGAAGSVVEAGVEFVESQAWALVERFMPSLVPILRQGIGPWLLDRVGAAAEGLFETGLAAIRRLTGFVPGLTEHFDNLVAWMRDAGAKLRQGDCSAIVEAYQLMQQTIDGLTAPILERMKAFADRVHHLFAGLWERFGAPVWQFLKDTASWHWERVKELGEFLWDLTAPIRKTLMRAWTWVKNKLGIGEGPEGQQGLLQWVQRKAGEAWEAIKTRLAPYKRQLLIVAGVLVMLSPAGPLIAIGAGVWALFRVTRRLAQILTRPNGVAEARIELETVVIPGIQRAVGEVSSWLAQKAAVIAARLNQVVGGLGGAVQAVAGSILRLAVSAVQWLLDRFRELVRWAEGALLRLSQLVSAALARLSAFLEPVRVVLRWVGRVLLDVFEVVSMVADRLWNLIPACIRDPIVRFITEHLLKRVPIIKALLDIPDVWNRIRTMVLQVIKGVFLGGSLKEAAITVFKFLLDLLKVPYQLALSVWAKGRAALDVIVSNPIGFLRNLVSALWQAFKQFGTNIFSHLWDGVTGWLFGQLDDAGIQRPEDFTFGSIFKLVLQILGITKERVFAIFSRKLDPPVVKALRIAWSVLAEAWDVIQAMVEKGAEGLEEHLSGLWERVKTAAINWLVSSIIVQALKRLAAYLVPTGINQIVGAIITTYNAIQSALRYARQLLQIVDRFLDRVTEIARGTISSAADALESLMGRAMPVMIGFLANQVGLGDIGDKLRDMIEKLQERVEQAIERLVDKLKEMGSSILALFGIGGGNELPRTEFDEEDGGEHHVLAWTGEGEDAVLTLSSARTAAVEQVLVEAEQRWSKRTGPKATKALEAIEDARDELEKIDAEEEAAVSDDEATREPALKRLTDAQDALARLLRGILGTMGLAKARLKYKTEGLTGSYGALQGIGGVGDDLTPDHQPAFSVLKAAGETRDSGEKGSLLFRAAGFLRSKWLPSRGAAALTINVHKIRHQAGRTYAGKANTVAGDAWDEMCDSIRGVTSFADRDQELARKRAAVIGVLQAEAIEDANATDAVYDEDENWTDIKGLKLDDEERDQLIKEIQLRAAEGEQQIRGQNLRQLAE